MLVHYRCATRNPILIMNQFGFSLFDCCTRPFQRSSYLLGKPKVRQALYSFGNWARPRLRWCRIRGSHLHRWVQLRLLR
jgi:hypothetical protein